MRLSAKFEDNLCVLSMIPENEWEKRLVGAVAGKTGMVSAEVEYQPDGHFSYQTAEAVRVVLRPTVVT